MFVLVKKQGNTIKKVIHESMDFNECVRVRQNKMSGANPNDEFNIYRKADYEELMNEEQNRVTRYNDWNKKRRNRYESRRKSRS